MTQPTSPSLFPDESFFPPSLTGAAASVLAAFKGRGYTLATAESCTGGMVSALLTSLPGSSAVVEAGFVTYANTAKEIMLGVAPSLIRTEGAVSRQVALAMAHGALESSSADVAVSITGIAGPDGGTSAKPVGTVHISVVSEQGQVNCQQFQFAGNRQQIRCQAALEALSMLLAMVESKAPDASA